MKSGRKLLMLIRLGGLRARMGMDAQRRQEGFTDRVFGRPEFTPCPAVCTKNEDCPL